MSCLMRPGFSYIELFTTSPLSQSTTTSSVSLSPLFPIVPPGHPIVVPSYQHVPLTTPSNSVSPCSHVHAPFF